jgi:hypothetical protein
MKLKLFFKPIPIILLVALTLMIIASFISKVSEPLWGFIGTIIGGMISYFATKESMLGQLKGIAYGAFFPKKLEVYQQAYSLWWEMQDNVYADPKIINEVHDRTKKFWIDNNLFMSEKLRKVYWESIDALIRHQANLNLLKSIDPSDRKNREEILEKNWDKLHLPSSVIIEELGMLADIEKEIRSTDKQEKTNS